MVNQSSHSSERIHHFFTVAIFSEYPHKPKSDAALTTETRRAELSTARRPGDGETPRIHPLDQLPPSLRCLDPVTDKRILRIPRVSSPPGLGVQLPRDPPSGHASPAFKLCQVRDNPVAPTPSQQPLKRKKKLMNARLCSWRWCRAYFRKVMLCAQSSSASLSA